MRQINSLFVTSHMTEYKKSRQAVSQKSRQAGGTSLQKTAFTSCKTIVCQINNCESCKFLIIASTGSREIRVHNAQAWKSMLDERELSAQVSTALTTGLTLSWKSAQRLGNGSRCRPHLQCHFICEHHPESGPNVTWTEAKWKSVLRSETSDLFSFWQTWTSLHLD